MSEHERLHSSDVCVQFVSHDQLVIGKDRSFRFDEVFPPDTSQVNVFLNSNKTEKKLAYCILHERYIAVVQYRCGYC